MVEEVRTAADLLTPESLRMIQATIECGSFAAAARVIGIVPSTMTYRIQVIERALDVLLFDRRSHKAHPTDACKELCREGSRLLGEMDHLAENVKRIASGWETSLTLAVDALVNRTVVLRLCKEFFALGVPTHLKICRESLNGTLEALSTGRADLAIGVVQDMDNTPHVSSRELGHPDFVFVVAPHHPLASIADPVGDETLQAYRAVAVADSTQNGDRMTIGLINGQSVFTVQDMQTMCDAIELGIGVGFLPAALARPLIRSGRLAEKRLERNYPPLNASYAWIRRRAGSCGSALKWWLDQLENPATRKALIS